MDNPSIGCDEKEIQSNRRHLLSARKGSLWIPMKAEFAPIGREGVVIRELMQCGVKRAGGPYLTTSVQGCPNASGFSKDIYFEFFWKESLADWTRGRKMVAFTVTAAKLSV
jgi:hypothetical protein